LSMYKFDQVLVGASNLIIVLLGLRRIKGFNSSFLKRSE
jgi:hypothetical protein